MLRLVAFASQSRRRRMVVFVAYSSTRSNSCHQGIVMSSACCLLQQQPLLLPRPPQMKSLFPYYAASTAIDDNQTTVRFCSSSAHLADGNEQQQSPKKEIAGGCGQKQQPRTCSKSILRNHQQQKKFEPIEGIRLPAARRAISETTEGSRLKPRASSREPPQFESCWGTEEEIASIAPPAVNRSSNRNIARVLSKERTTKQKRRSTPPSDQTEAISHREFTGSSKRGKTTTNTLLLDLQVYPIGFSNTRTDAEVNHWYSQMDRALKETKPFFLESALSLMDRLLHEEDASLLRAPSSSPLPRVSAEAVGWVLELWRTSWLCPQVGGAATSRRRVHRKRVSRYSASSFADHNGSALALVFQAMTASRRKEKDATTSDPQMEALLPPAHGFDESKDATATNSNRQLHSEAQVGETSAVSTTSDEAGHTLIASCTQLVVLPSSESWEDSTRRLLDLSVFPIGFSNSHLMTTKVDTWFGEVEQALQQTTPGYVKQAFQLLDRWLQEEERAAALELPASPISVGTLDCVLECWKTSLLNGGTTDNTESPEEVWDRVSRFSTSGHNNSILSSIIHAIGLIEDPSKAPFRGEALLQSCLETLCISDTLSSSSDHLNTATTNRLLQLWHRSLLPESPASADRLLQQLRDWYAEESRLDRKPDDVTYATVIAIWTAIAAPGAAVRRAEVLMGEMQHVPGFLVHGTVIDALAKAGHVERARKVLSIFVQTQEKVLNGGAENVNSIETLEGCSPVLSILEAYRKRLDRQPSVAMAQLERFISQMETLASENVAFRRVFHPNAACYNVLIGAYTKLRVPQRAEGLLGHVMRLHESTGNIVIPGNSSPATLTTVWNGVLEAWAQSGDAETVPRVVALVKNMEEKCQKDRACQPSPQTYNTLLYCLANDRRNSAVENAREAQELLERMEMDEADIICKPNGDSYDTVLRAWCKAGYPDQAESLLHRLCSQMCSADDATEIRTAYPTSLQFITVMYGWAKIARRRNGQHRALERVEQLLQAMHVLHARGYPTKPSLTAYNIFLECLTKSHEIDAPERAESFLRLMEKNGQIDEGLKPDAVIFNSVLTTWLRSNRNDAPAKASALFNEMKRLNMGTGNVINAFTYTTLMGIYAQHTLPAKAQETFEEMLQASDQRIRVPFSAYTTLLQAWAVAGKPEIAFEVVEMLRREHADGNVDGPSKGSTLAFNAVLNSLSDSRQHDAAEKAESCLETMHLLATSGKFDVRPDLVSYSLAIKSFSRSRHPDAGHRAAQIFDRMKSLYMESGDPSICPDLKIYMDLIAVLTKSGRRLSRESSSLISRSGVTRAEQIHRLLDEIDSLVHPSCWIDQGELVFSRIAWQFTESDLFTTTQKVQLMLQLRRLANQHSVKLDRTIMMLLNQYRQLEAVAPS